MPANTQRKQNPNETKQGRKLSFVTSVRAILADFTQTKSRLGQARRSAKMTVDGTEKKGKATVSSAHN